MTQVVLRQKPSVHAAYQAMGEDLAVSVTSVYNTPNGVEADTSRALVRYGADPAQIATSAPPAFSGGGPMC